MPDGGSALSSAWIWLIPLLLLAALAGLVLFALWRQRQARQALQQVGRQLRLLERNGRQIRQAIGALPEAAGPPYSLYCQKLNEQATAWEQSWMALRQVYIETQRQGGRLGRASWRSAVGAPFDWHALWQQACRLVESAEQLEAQLAALGAALADYDRLAWQVAQRVQALLQQQAEAEQELQRLVQSGLQGEELKQTEAELNSLRAGLEEIDPLLRQGREDEVLARAEQAMVVQAYARLGQVEAALPPLHQRVRGWQEQVDQIQRLNQRLQQTLQQVATALQQAPEGLDLSEEQARFRHLQQIAAAMGDTVSRLEVDSLELISKEADRLQGICQEMQRDLQQAFRQQQTLVQGLAELQQSLPALAERMGRLAMASVLKVDWPESKPLLERLQQQLSAVVQSSRPASPKQLPRTVATLEGLLAQGRALSQQVQEVEAQHTELVLLLRQLQAENWLEGGLELARQAAEFGPQNWPSAEAVQSLPQELEELLAVRRSLPQVDGSAALAEGKLLEYLEAARQLVEESQDYQQRLQRVQQRLAQLRQWEQQAQERVDQALIIVGQLLYLARSSAFLQGLLGAELNRWQSSLQALQGDLRHRERDAVERKRRQAEEWTSRIKQKAAQWRQQLVQEVRSQAEALGATLESLRQIAPLAERAVDAASRVQQAVQGALAERSAELALDELVPEFKRLSDLWQECRAAAAALQDIARPLQDSHAKALESRQQAAGQLQEYARLLRPGGWPPFSTGIQAEQAEFRRIEADWQALPRHSWRAMDLIAQLERLAARYLAVTERMHRAAERAMQEQERVLELEQALDDLAQSWSGHLTTFADSPTAVREVRSLLNRLQYRRNQLRQQVKQGSLEFATLLKELKTLQQEALYFKARLDAGHSVDIEGRVIPGH